MKEHDGCHHYEGSDGEQICSLYVGTVMEHDPCGQYHPFGGELRCAVFWLTLEEELGDRGIALIGSDGDPCDLIAERIINGGAMSCLDA
jgi:hypothetical protein